MTVLVFVDPEFPAGRPADPSQPQLSVLDQGVTRGDGVFETLLYTGGAVRKLDAHLARLESSAAMCELPVPSAQAWRSAVGTAVAAYDAARSAAGATEAPGMRHEATVKLVATRGPEGATHGTAWVTVSPAPELGQRQRETGLSVITLDRGYDSEAGDRAPWLLMGAKTLSYGVNMAALRHARKQGADDVIFVSSDGHVLEGATSTVLLAHREGPLKRLVTPTLQTGILPGTTQGAIFAAAQSAGWELGYGPLETQDLFEADAVWLVSSVRLLAPINSIDGVGIPRDRELHAELARMVDGIR
ncbi:4-amino-4-deoxychorismate lyase [Zafaria cholistanensis]|uniref:4-amino-4-deoxychorismate lyase n=1 Tax=Zafaria cholistanensis TaxID=1682741 RepID=A0A5A7NN52_9MICC|nr:aminodeoxychorismate lyase [Zafaria cholistanensis]GER22374.1 4-amino-4-deoxychorismate lyase [Zafaria cholistanensis]